MKVGDKRRADKIPGRYLCLLDHETDLKWVRDVFPIHTFPEPVQAFVALIFIGYHEDSPDAIWGIKKNHYQAPATLLYLSGQEDNDNGSVQRTNLPV